MWSRIPGARRAGAAAAALLVASCTGAGGDGAPPSSSSAPASGTLAVAGQGARPAAGEPARQPRPGDLNGDGYDDAAVAVGPDRIAVVYGSAHGLDPRTRSTLRAELPGQRVTGVPWARFARGDLDGDGFTDLLVTLETGQQYALWGGPRGVTRPTRLPGGTAVVVGRETLDWEAGRVGDFDGDGAADVYRLAAYDGTGTPSGGTVSYGPFDRGGRPARTQRLDGKRPADSAPYKAVAGDYDGDGRDELTVWFRWTDPDSEGDGDTTVLAVHHFHGGPRGLSLTQRSRTGEGYAGVPADADGDGDDELVSAAMNGSERTLTLSVNQDPGTGAPSTRTIPGVEVGDAEGRAVGDVTGDGRPDLVVASPHADTQQGLVYLVPDVARAPAARPQSVGLDTPGIHGASERRRSRVRFQSRPPLLDADGDGHLDVVAQTERGRGLRGLWLLPGSGTGLDATGSRFISARELGLPAADR
ncbi:FG-GAP and VCBS repeat-containing protein [Streptomyces sp. MAR4 CNX-425]|uniref:FG-GAP and VCBS repeat-containing protein n=1 Tax=Streptomyces sp. MAR4 CNX-425 TaxID=3406343 RepID=UPI003B513127